MCPGGCWNSGPTPYTVTGSSNAGMTNIPVIQEGADINAVARQQACNLMFIQLNTYIQAQIAFYSNRKEFSKDFKRDLKWFTTQSGYRIQELHSSSYDVFIEAVPEVVGLNRLVAGVYLYKPQNLISIKSLLVSGVNNTGVLKIKEGTYQTEELTIVGYSNQCY